MFVKLFSNTTETGSFTAWIWLADDAHRVLDVFPMLICLRLPWHEFKKTNRLYKTDPAVKVVFSSPSHIDATCERCIWPNDRSFWVSAAPCLDRTPRHTCHSNRLEWFSLFLNFLNFKNLPKPPASLIICRGETVDRGITLLTLFLGIILISRIIQFLCVSVTQQTVHNMLISRRWLIFNYRVHYLLLINAHQGLNSSRTLFFFDKFGNKVIFKLTVQTEQKQCSSRFLNHSHTFIRVTCDSFTIILIIIRRWWRYG